MKDTGTIFIGSAPAIPYLSWFQFSSQMKVLLFWKQKQKREKVLGIREILRVRAAFKVAGISFSGRTVRDDFLKSGSLFILSYYMIIYEGARGTLAALCCSSCLLKLSHNVNKNEKEKKKTIMSLERLQILLMKENQNCSFIN